MIYPSQIIKYQLYLLQLENYELGRYFKLLFKKGLWPKGEQRKDLVWTQKAKALMLMAGCLHFLIGIGLVFWVMQVDSYTDVVAVLIWLAILYFLYFILFSLCLLLLWPFDFFAKKTIVAKAASKIQSLSQGIAGQELKVIGVAGSYGKTTMKEVLAAVLSAHFKVLETPESVNTPVGIGRWILNKVDSSTQIIIVEMGEHYKGDIEDLCNIAKPDIAVVTGINEAHLERMKTMDAVASTVFEIVSHSKPGALIVLNGDDKNVIDNYKKFVWPDHKIEKFSTRGGSAFGGKISNFKFQNFNTERLGWNLTIEEIGEVFVNLLGHYAIADVDAAVKIAKSLGMSAREIKKGIEKIKPVEHRLQPIKSAGNILVIDDSYNGNSDGVKEAIQVLSRFTTRRKIYITPGLVEMGKSSEDVHRNIGKQLAAVADVVILIKNSVTGFIEEGIKESDKSAEVLWFDTALEAHASLGKILKPGDVVVFQNDWGDQYL